MSFSRSDRPYGSFPGSGTPPPEPPPPAPPRPSLRRRVWRIVATPLALAGLLALSWTLATTVDSGGRRALRDLAERPTPSPTPALAAQVYDQVAPSVVQIRATRGRPDPDVNTGAGVVVDDQADILTSLHVVNGASDIQVRFSDGTQSRALVVATLPDKDIAVLRAVQPPQKLVVATLGNPGLLRIGDPAFVIGHPFGLAGSLSAGVVSGLDRTLQAPGIPKPITGLIQFDAAVNPGSSGGPLVDQRGDVVGIVTGLVNPGGSSVFSGVGFAVTIEDAGGALGEPPD